MSSHGKPTGSPVVVAPVLNDHFESPDETGPRLKARRLPSKVPTYSVMSSHEVTGGLRAAVSCPTWSTNIDGAVANVFVVSMIQYSNADVSPAPASLVTWRRLR